MATNPTFEQARERVILLGVRAMQSYMATEELSRGGTPHKVNPTERQRRWHRLNALVEVLDQAFKWYGEWGQTPHAIEQELGRRAGIHT